MRFNWYMFSISDKNTHIWYVYHWLGQVRMALTNMDHLGFLSIGKGMSNIVRLADTRLRSNKNLNWFSPATVANLYPLSCPSNLSNHLISWFFPTELTRLCGHSHLSIFTYPYFYYKFLKPQNCFWQKISLKNRFF